MKNSFIWLLTINCFIGFLNALSISKQVKLGNISYYVPGTPELTVDQKLVTELFGNLESSFLFPLTVINFSGDLSCSSLSSISESFSSDDVFSEYFLGTVLVQSSNVTVTSSFNHSISALNVSNVMSLGGSALPNGPYFGSYLDGSLSIYKAYRLYADTYAAFQSGIVPSDENADAFMPLPAGVEVAHAQTIAVPSRLYYTVSEEQPLAGYRVGIKDLYDIAGIKTGGSSRPYYELYDEANVTCPSVQRLIDMGAIIVGKMKLTQFANGERPTADYVDYHAPFNPRGDGYQYPSGSSSGSGAAEAAYDWLDFTVGSDTGCSVRCPAGSQGLYGLRPSFDAISLEGVIPMSDIMDTAGFLARDPGLFKVVGDAWYGENKNISSNYTSFPKTVYTFAFEERKSDFIEGSASPEAIALFNKFVNNVVSFLNGSNVQLDIYSQFEKDTGSSVDEVFNGTWSGLAGYYQYVNIWEPFSKDFQEANNGDTPFLDPIPKFRWDWAYYNFTEKGYNNAVQHKELFDQWWNANVTTANPETCSNSIYIFLSSPGSAAYRNTYVPAPTVASISGFSELYISSFARTPEAVIPLGEIAYNSTITLTKKYLPVTAAIGAAPGCDFMVLDLIERLGKANIIGTVATGQRLFP
ncbi:related to D-mandelate dehydrogenase [Zygosaccharomyces bailii ISA1307]|nr:related to D-mandelate dehydrogenase [Zygosaccharomyces bailii ISA1307]